MRSILNIGFIHGPLSIWLELFSNTYLLMAADNFGRESSLIYLTIYVWFFKILFFEFNNDLFWDLIPILL